MSKLQQYIKIADLLDKLGYHDEANKIDALALQAALELEMEKEVEVESDEDDKEDDKDEKVEKKKKKITLSFD